MFLVYALFVKDRKRIYKENIIIKCMRIILIIVLSPFVVIFLIKNKISARKQAKLNAEKIKIYSISQINLLSGTEFEQYLKLLFEKMGYKVQTTKKSKDFGADLILEKKGIKTIVQAKRLSHTVGISAVQEIISARKHYNISQAMVVSNQNYSKEAEILANENQVILAGTNELETMIQRFPVYFETEKRTYVATTSDAIKQIETKYPFWIWKFCLSLKTVSKF